ncbi:hypothetical protein ABEY54_28900 [Priestia megaterium]
MTNYQERSPQSQIRTASTDPKVKQIQTAPKRNIRSGERPSFQAPKPPTKQ